MKKTFLVLLVSLFFTAQIALAGEEKLNLTAAASSTGYDPSNYGPSKTLDGDDLTRWVGGKDMAPWWIAFDIGKVEKVDRIVINWYNCPYFAPSSYDIQISSDGVNWTNLFTGIQAVTDAQGDMRDMKQKARYIRLYINSVAFWFPMINEFTAYKSVTIPSVLRFKGRLGDSAEEPLTGSFKLTFRLYDKEANGAPLWTEIEDNVSIEDGLLNVELGNINPMNLPFDRQYWLGVEAESNGEMSPRFRLTGVPYSFTSLQ